MDEACDEVVLEEAMKGHRIAAGLFVPFVIGRLRGSSPKTEALFTVHLRDIGEQGTQQRQLRLQWSPKSGVSLPFGVQENTVTEWAALGMASVIVWRYAGLHIRDVTIPGEKFDYWVNGGNEDFGLEVSGTMMGDVESRHGEKVRQLRENPAGRGGYVVVTGFLTREVIFSYNCFEGAAS